jgi:hypothetical protein
VHAVENIAEGGNKILNAGWGCGTEEKAAVGEAIRWGILSIRRLLILVDLGTSENFEWCRCQGRLEELLICMP